VNAVYSIALVRNLKVKQEIEVEPLTRTTRAGKVLKRRLEVEEQIKEVLGLDLEELEPRLSERDYRAVDFIKPEVIVYLIRRALKMGDDDVVNRLSTALIGQITRTIEGKVRVLSPHLREDSHSEIIVHIFEAVINLATDTGDYAQVSFGDWLDKRAADIMRKWWKFEKEGQVTDSLTREEHDDTSEENDPADRDFRPGELAREEYPVLIDAALSALDENERGAFLLRHLWEWEIENADPTVPTISRRFGVTAKTIRNWLNSADKKIKTWRTKGGPKP